jgi:hypothetical protein
LNRPALQGAGFLLGGKAGRGRHGSAIYERRKFVFDLQKQNKAGLELLHMDSRFTVELKVCPAAPLSGQVVEPLFEGIIACRIIDG